MSRPKKQGLDYFPLDVDIESDDKVYLIQAKHGVVGFGLLIKLFIKIYRNGYYARFSEREEIIFASQNNIQVNLCRDIINDCINEAIFDKNIYEKFKILTSIGIQKRYFEVSERRKKIEYFKEITLIDVLEHKNLVSVNINQLNVDIKSIEADINPTKQESTTVNANICPESKQKVNRKETESKQKVETETLLGEQKTVHPNQCVGLDKTPANEHENHATETTKPVDWSADRNGKVPERDTATTSESPVGFVSPEKEDAQTDGEISTGSDPPTGTAQKKEVYNERIVEIVDYFNQKAGTSYKHDTPETVRCIVARLKRGFTVDDFKAVIDKKTAQWKDDPKMQAYLRPITLFSTKFESYLNELVGGVHGRFGNSKPTHVGETEKPKGKYADQVDEVIYTDA